MRPWQLGENKDAVFPTSSQWNPRLWTVPAGWTCEIRCCYLQRSSSYRPSPLFFAILHWCSIQWLRVKEEDTFEHGQARALESSYKWHRARWQRGGCDPKQTLDTWHCIRLWGRQRHADNVKHHEADTDHANSVMFQRRISQSPISQSLQCKKNHKRNGPPDREPACQCCYLRLIRFSRHKRNLHNSYPKGALNIGQHTLR